MVKKFFLVSLLIMLISACTTPKTVVTDQYHESDSQKPVQKALNGLQLKALEYMNQQDFEKSILYLQRAIKIEPRNPLNWHYLAQNYWHLQDYANCRSMVKRAMSYSQLDQDLMRANHALFEQCSP